MTMPTGDNTKKTEEKAKREERWTFIPYFVERMFGAVESFSDRVTDMLSDKAHVLVNRAVQRMFTLLLLGVGIVFLLTGGAEVINHIANFPGIGQMVVGAFLLLVTGIVMLLSRRHG